MTEITWRHRPQPPAVPIVPRSRIYGDAPPPLATVPPSRPQTILNDVAHEHALTVGEMVNTRGSHPDAAPMLRARIDACGRLRAIGMSTTMIGRFLKRDHSTIVSYLRGSR